MDDHAKEQDALLHEYVLSREGKAGASADPWSADGPSSISPFVPCAASRIPHVLRAARLTPDDVLWDLGCGDGRLLHQAASQYGCKCVGLDIDAPCIDDAIARAAQQQAEHLCSFATADLTALQPGALQPTADGTVELGAAVRPDASGAPPRFLAPTVVLLFITAHGLTRLESFLYGEWSRGGLRILTCVESFASCFDFESADPLFGYEETRHEWPIYEAFERHGVYVVPPLETDVEAWAALEAMHGPRTAPTPAEVDAASAQPGAYATLRGVLTLQDMEAIDALGKACEARESEAGAVGAADESLSGEERARVDGDEEVSMAALDLFASDASETDILSAAEDCMHGSRLHRVVHLHRDGQFQTALPVLLDKVLARVRTADAAGWRLLLGRPINIRSAEWHVYRPGGAVSAPEHRDTGSLLTLTCLLTPPERYEGATLTFPLAGDGGAATPQLACGDGVLFPSEMRHNVTPLISGERRSFVVELWEGGPNSHNRWG